MANCAGKFPIYTITDELHENLKVKHNGEYLCSAFEYRGLKFKKQFHNEFVVLRLRELGIKIQVLYGIKTHLFLRKTHFRPFVETLLEMVEIDPRKLPASVMHIRTKGGTGNKVFKQMCNCFTGWLGKKFKHAGKELCTNHEETAVLMYVRQITISEGNVSICKKTEIYFIREIMKYTLRKTNWPILRTIYSHCTLSVINMIETLSSDTSELMTIKSDCTWITNSKDIRSDNWTVENDGKLLKYNVFEQSNLTYPFEKLWIKIAEPSRSYLCSAPVGAGKTELLADQFDDDSRAMAFTCSAKTEIIDRLITKKKKNPKASTLEGYFMSYAWDDKLLIDEYTMIPISMYTELYLRKIKNPEMVFQFYGDHMQLYAVKSKYNYMDCRFMKFLTNHRVHYKGYDTKSRFSDNLRELMSVFWETGKMSDFTRGSFLDLFKLNVVATNMYIKMINNRFPKIQEGTLVIARYRSKHFEKGRILDVEKIEDDKLLLEGKWAKKCQFEKAHTVTCHKYQGQTVRERI